MDSDEETETEYYHGEDTRTLVGEEADMVVDEEVDVDANMENELLME